MISRRSAESVAMCYANTFARTVHTSKIVYVENGGLYDFLYINDHEAWLCNAVKSVHEQRTLKELIMKLHTGETISSIAPNSDWERKKILGQKYLLNLAETYLKNYLNDSGAYISDRDKKRASLLNSNLELDGYRFEGNTLFYPESDILDIAEENGVLQYLHKKLNLANSETAFKFLKLSEEHYLTQKWEDCISNSRKFFESVMQEIAASFSLKFLNQPLSDKVYSWPVKVREFLEDNALLEKKEREAIDKIYGLLSHTGSHPYMAEKDQARLLRQLALVISQFVMLRYEGKLK